MIIYKILNKINGKIYIGQTIGTLEHRMSQHKANNKKNSIIGKAIQKYGWNNFDVEVIDEAETIEELNNKEIYWIGYYKSLVPNGYNIEIGGKNAPNGEEIRQKISIANKGRFVGEKSSKSKKVYKFSLDGKLICEYGSVREASRQNNISNSQIASVCRGEHFIAKGYRWSYEKDNLSKMPNKSSVIITYNGVSANIKDWSRNLGFPYQTLLNRLKNGWSIEKAFETPIMISKRNKRCGR
jgi:hypothetical protein